MAFTGQVMRWDADAYWGVGVGASMAGRVPLIGPYIVDLMLGAARSSAPIRSAGFSLSMSSSFPVCCWASWPCISGWS